MKIYDSTLLSRHKVYEIKGAFYRFLWQEDNIQYIQHPQYRFRPLPGQRKKAVIGHKKLTTSCYEVPGVKIHSYVCKEYIQLSIFDFL